MRKLRLLSLFLITIIVVTVLILLLSKKSLQDTQEVLESADALIESIEASTERTTIDDERFYTWSIERSRDNIDVIDISTTTVSDPQQYEEEVVEEETTSQVFEYIVDDTPLATLDEVYQLAKELHNMDDYSIDAILKWTSHECNWLVDDGGLLNKYTAGAGISAYYRSLSSGNDIYYEIGGVDGWYYYYLQYETIDKLALYAFKLALQDYDWMMCTEVNGMCPENGYYGCHSIYDAWYAVRWNGMWYGVWYY